MTDALTADGIVGYHAQSLKEATTGERSAERSYFAADDPMGGEWRGQQSKILGLYGRPVTEPDLRAVADGRHWQTGEQLIAHRPPAAKIPRYVASDGEWRSHLGRRFQESISAGRFDLEKPGPKVKIGKSAVEYVPSPKPELTDRRAALLEMHAIAKELYAANLHDKEKGGDWQIYLSQRNISRDSAVKFGLGVALNSRTQLYDLLKDKYDRELLVASGLFVEQGKELQDRFYGRLMFPIENEHGETVGFGARKPDGSAMRDKYVNSPGTELFKKSELLYNFHRAAPEAAKTGQVVLTEGYLDVIAADQAGVSNVVAGMGTALSETQIESLSKVSGTVIAAWDNDEAGRQARERNVPALLRGGINVRTLAIDGKDTAKYLEDHKPEQYRKQLGRADSLLEFLGKTAAEKFPVPDVSGVDFLADIGLEEEGSGNAILRENQEHRAKWIAGVLENVAPAQREAITRELDSYLKRPDDPEAEKVREHRAGWDITLSAPKTISLTGLVGGDERVVKAHKEAVRESVDYAERYIQVKMGGLNAPQTTQRAVFALFDHDTARPVNGYAAPQLHTHAVLFNMSQDADGKYRSLNPREMFYLQATMEAVYQSRLAVRLKALGYELEYGSGRHRATEIKGYTDEYRKAESPRTELIEKKKAEIGQHGPQADSIVALSTREAKLNLPPEQIRAMHEARAAEYGNQPAQVVAAAKEREPVFYSADTRAEVADAAVQFAKRRLSERTTVMEDFEIHRDALWFGRGYIVLRDVEAAFDRQRGQFIETSHWRSAAPAHRWTTPEMVAKETKILEWMRDGRHTVGAIASEREGDRHFVSKQMVRDEFDAHLAVHQKPGRPRIKATGGQQHVVWDAMHSTDRIVGIQGLAGVGKTSSLSVLRHYAEGYGLEAYGVAATSTATAEMRSAGMPSETIQAFLQPTKVLGKRPRAYFVDESSLVDVHNFAEFLDKMKPSDRIFVIGDRKQHGSLGAGRVFAQLQDAGMETHHLRKIIRQTNEAYREEVKLLSKGRVTEALESLDARGRIQEIPHEGKRYKAIAKAVLAANPKVLVVSPDNASLAGISAAIREAKQEAGLVAKQGYRAEVLLSRGDLTTSDSELAVNYKTGDVLLYATAGDKKLGIARGDYASVVSADHETNSLKILKWSDGQVVTYDPSKTKLHPTVYEQAEREFAVGDRVQFTQQNKEYIPYDPVTKKKGHSIVHAPNRALGTIEHLDDTGRAAIRLDKGEKLVEVDLTKFQHVDHGYTLTSYSSQSVTAPEVIVHIDTDAIGASRLLSQQLFYVAWSRGQEEGTLFTNSREELDSYLSRDVQNATALAPEVIAKFRKEEVGLSR